jgi:hypothetical protein
VWSRKILGWEVHDIECNDLAAALVERICHKNAGIDLRGWGLHADNGGPMKGATTLATVQRLGVVPSFSRPSVSDDNPYVESLFRTMKYSPEYPSAGFASVEQAREWVARFVAWYIDAHKYGFVQLLIVTPATTSRSSLRASTSASPRTLVAAHARVEATRHRNFQPGGSSARSDPSDHIRSGRQRVLLSASRPKGAHIRGAPHVTSKERGRDLASPATSALAEQSWPHDSSRNVREIHEENN